MLQTSFRIILENVLLYLHKNKCQNILKALYCLETVVNSVANCVSPKLTYLVMTKEFLDVLVIIEGNSIFVSWTTLEGSLVPNGHIDIAAIGVHMIIMVN